AIGPIPTVAPLYVCITATTFAINRSRLWLIGNSSADDRPQAERSQRIPKPVIVTTIPMTLVSLATIAVPVSPSIMVSVNPVVPVPLSPLVPVLDRLDVRKRVGLRHHCSRDRRDGGHQSECEAERPCAKRRHELIHCNSNQIRDNAGWLPSPR